VACCFADGIGPSGFIKCGVFLDYLRNYKLRKKDSVEPYQLHNCEEGNLCRDIQNMHQCSSTCPLF